MSDQNSSILRGPARVLYHEEDRNAGEPVVQMAEHDFMFSEATGSSGLSMDCPNLLVDLGKSNERKKVPVRGLRGGDEKHLFGWLLI
jgi:hypothetical protein